MKPLVASGMKLYGVTALHAKIYRSESEVILTSLNLKEKSFLNNIETGLWSQAPAALQAVDAFIKQEIHPFTHPIELGEKRAARAERRRATSRGVEGHCVRCGDGIPLNPVRPYCRDDFAEWDEWGNENYVDRFCHGCGKDFPATMARPLCKNCYRKAMSA